MLVAVLVAVLVVGALGALGWHVWWNVSGRSRPWTEEPFHPSPDGRCVVFREGRNAFMELETRITIAESTALAEAGRDVLVPWSELWPRHVEWKSDHELVVELGQKTDASVRSSTRRTWRAVEVELVYR
ncbi:MAG: hypothetical protein L6Q99_18480 [Planctomycetes bacterium]|nr:hypothetical protein [Planctomycetota bacterium]